MSNPEEQFKINLNQSLWGLIVGLTGLGIAEHFALCTLFWFSVVTSGGAADLHLGDYTRIYHQIL